MSAPQNVEPTKGGKVRPVCEHCGRKGRAVTPDERGHLDLFALGRGWSVAPYPPDFVHRDGSTGDMFSCPACNGALNRGESLRSRAYLEPGQVEQSAARAKASFRADTMSRQGAERYVSEVLGERAAAHDVEAIADELRTATGSWDMRAADSGRFWAAVRRHALDVPAPHCADWPLCGHEGGTCPTD